MARFVVDAFVIYTSSAFFLSQNQALAFSTRSANAWDAAQFRWATTSSDYWKTANNFFATTSSDYWDTTKFRWATTSTAYWESTQTRWATSSSDYWETQRNFFSTTSVDAWDITKWRWSTSSSDYAVNTLINSSSTIARTTLANLWTPLQTFAGGFIGQGSSTVTGLTTLAGGLTLPGITGSLLHTNSTGGVTGTTTLAVNFGGTGSSTLTGILKGNGTGIIQSAIAGTDYLLGSGIAGNCVKWGANNLLTDQGSPCGSGGGSGGGTWATTTPYTGGPLTSAPNLGTVSASLTGFLKATTGVLSTALVDLASNITGILPVQNGGTGWTNIAASAIPYGNGSGVLATTERGHRWIRPRVSQWRPCVDGHDDIQRSALVLQRSRLHCSSERRHRWLPLK